MANTTIRNKDRDGKTALGADVMRLGWGAIKLFGGMIKIAWKASRMIINSTRPRTEKDKVTPQARVEKPA